MAAASTSTPTTVVGNSADPTGVVVWMHGLGDSPRGWSSFCAGLARSMPHLKFVLPEAPVNPVSCNGGARMTSWMDLEEIPIFPESPDNGLHLPESLAIIDAIISDEIAKGIPSERVVVGGFSQGGAMSLATVVKSERKLGGCAVLSGWALPKQDIPSAVPNSANKDTPFLVCHGESDQVVVAANGPLVAKILKDGGASSVQLHTYPGMPHSSCPKEERDVAAWLSEVLP
mmetsp:Transcript_35776/g.95972  ORF Transcript_35776/g.95972 Transcript_35776/m.95972 type:complete len:230 (-) Transcript_35776:399-1088(-)